MNKEDKYLFSVEVVWDLGKIERTFWVQAINHAVAVDMAVSQWRAALAEDLVTTNPVFRSAKAVLLCKIQDVLRDADDILKREG